MNKEDIQEWWANDKCPQCGEVSSQLRGDAGDFEAINDEYYCGGCNISWHAHILKAKEASKEEDNG